MSSQKSWAGSHLLDENLDQHLIHYPPLPKPNPGHAVGNIWTFLKLGCHFLCCVIRSGEPLSIPHGILAHFEMVERFCSEIFLLFTVRFSPFFFLIYFIWDFPFEWFAKRFIPHSSITNAKLQIVMLEIVFSCKM